MAMDDALQLALAKIQQGPTQVVIDPSSDNVELFVEGGVTVRFIKGREEQSVDTVGVYDLVTSGDGAEVALTVPETSYNVLALLFRDYAGVANTYKNFGRAAGYSTRANAKAMRIRPWQTRTVTTTQIDLWKCVPSGDAEKTMGPGGKYQWTQTFRALPDLTKDDQNLIGRIRSSARGA